MRKRRRGSSSILKVLVTITLLSGVGYFAYNSPYFEREVPKINIKGKLYVNSKIPLKFTIEDNVAVKSCRVMLTSKDEKYHIYDQKFLQSGTKKDIEINLPIEVIESKNSDWIVTVVARDKSYWGFFMGNKSTFEGKLQIDNTPPRITILSNSSSIIKGGSALVIYRVKEKSLKETYVDIGDGIKFKAIKYRKNGVYATLVAWPFNKSNFNPKVVAVDNAENISKSSLNINKLNKKYRISNIRARDKFIDGKITELANNSQKFSNIDNKIDRFRAVNEKMRLANEKLIHKYSSAVTPFGNKWGIKQFKPLRRAKRVSDFGSKRFYYYKSRDNIISTSFHVGYDFASVKHDNLYSSSGGVVKFASNNGIYGNMPLIDHKFGLYTIYGHCSEILVKVGDSVKSGQIVAKTGKSGLALGDHVHFGMLVQGVEVYPLEWMSKKWISTHIDAIFRKADRILGYN